ncbi:MAG: hypothetical protein ACXADH_03990 [Candidatus Kariarchaeaceae archaeon]|jgi:hypothetical protein
MKLKEIKPRNFVAKHAQRSGAGRHEAKNGKHVKRAKQKQNLRRQFKLLDF